MLGIGKQQRKFDLLYLEEGEQYIKEFTGIVEFFDVTINDYRKAQAFIHFCSRSLVIEIENESTQPIYKYLFKFFTHEPGYGQGQHLPLKIYVSKLVEVPALSVPKPYKYHQMDANSKGNYELSVQIQYQSVETLYKSIYKLYELFKSKNSFHYEQDLDKMFFFNSEFFSNTSFDKTRIKSLSEKTLLNKEFRVRQIIPMIQLEGLLYLTNKRVYFQPFNSFYKKPVINFKIKDISELFKRRYKLMNIGLELITKKQKSLYVAFSNTEERDSFYQALKQHVDDSCITAESSIVDYTQQWVNGGISNLQYLLLLNSYAQRSFQDLTQYPVFPWILQDYKSDVLDLKDESIYRDLSKPIGALNEKRLKDFIIRYNECPEGEKYLYGTHYSCPGYVIGFLVRQHPQWMIKFQGGKFDNPNRLFKGVGKEWISVNTNPGNVKELIPEFFLENPDFLVNKLKLDLGIRSNGKRVDDAKLPNWATSPEDFLKKHRQALESDYVSNNLHLWIDLIFGSKQRSFEDFNVFHPLTYEGSLDFEKLQDPIERIAYEVQITEFGQTPRQLFRKPHPQKYSKVIPKTLTATLESIQTTATAQPKQHEEEKLENKFKQLMDEERSPKNNNMNSEFQSVQSNQKDGVQQSIFKDISTMKKIKIDKVHKDEITSINIMYEDDYKVQKIVTTSMDGFIKMVDSRDKQVKKAFYVCQSGINSSTPLSSQDSFALAAQNHNIYVFSFLTGTTITNFYAHDDIINKVLFQNDKLITCSSDQTLRIWDLKGSNFSNPQILYDHEEEIISASVHQNMLSSMDVEGNIIIRDMRNMDIVSTINLNRQYESGLVLFNNKMKNELFVLYNNDLEIYDIDGRVISRREFDNNVTNAVQDEDCLLMSYQNGGFACYDWNDDKIVDEIEDYIAVKSVTTSSNRVNKNERMIVCGSDNGEIHILQGSK